MSKAIPTKPPQRPFQPTYSVTTTTRVPGRAGGREQLDETDESTSPAVTDGPLA
jgi:hypothetical protein